MSQAFEGEPKAGERPFGIVVARFNELVTRRLLEGATETFRDHGVDEKRLTTVWVPGSFEIPLVAHCLAKSGKFAAVCCLGAVIQGETSHHEYINQQVSREIMRAGVESGIPVIFGVLNCHNMQQAMDRAGGRVGNKGSEAALAALQMASLLDKLADAGI